MAARRRLMARACGVCNHPDRDAIDKAVVDRSQSHRAIALHYGISRFAVDRHVQHISAALKTVRLNRETGANQSLMERIESLISRTENFLSTAEKTGQVAQGLAAVRELRALLELLGKASGELKPDGATTVVNILQSPEILQVIRAVRTVLSDQPDRLQQFSDLMRLPEHVE
jgi:hypothetical protein